MMEKKKQQTGAPSKKREKENFKTTQSKANSGDKEKRSS